MGKIIVSDFSSSKVFRPRRGVVSSVDTKILLESMISAFGLSIRLRVISGREAKSSVSEREQFTPEVREEARITIGDNATGKTV